MWAMSASIARQFCRGDALPASFLRSGFTARWQSARPARWLADRHGLDASDFITFGDGLGDLEMVRWPGRGYAVGDAHPEVMAAAYAHIPGPDSEGVAEELERLSADGMLHSRI